MHDKPEGVSEHNITSTDESVTAPPSGSEKATSGSLWKNPGVWLKRKHGNAKKPATPPDEKQNALEHLPDNEKDIILKQLDVKNEQYGFKDLFRYATPVDFLVLTISAICALAAGAVLPLMTVIFGTLAGTFQDYFLGDLTGDAFKSRLAHFTLYYVYLAIADFVVHYISTVGFTYTGEHITSKIREKYFLAILQQNIAFFDNLGAGEITTRITADMNQIQDGISGKVGLTLTALGAFVSAFIVGFVEYWLLTLILSSLLVSILLTMGCIATFIIKWTKASIEAYGTGGTVAEEALSSIRNVTAFSTQQKIAGQYDVHLARAQYWGVRQKSMFGLVMGTMTFQAYLAYALAFWQGSRFLVSGQGNLALSGILIIQFAVMMGSFALVEVGPYVGAFTTATAAAGKVYNTIDRVSPLNPCSTEGRTLEHVKGEIELQNIRHIYPSRPDVVVMKDFSLLVPAAKVTALVGASGSGKSTIVGLVERFYDPVGGQVLLDGVDIRELNLNFLRQQISIVSQEPSLFNTTIHNNIAHGLIGTRYEGLTKPEQTELVITAAKMANAHDFIMDFPEQYNTKVGDKGSLTSGGQKQRIAIARAIVSNPKILLLDEATSALDTKSEEVVQAALKKASEGRTTISIAHRLSTIREADNIVIMADGAIVEQGTHNELLQKKSTYYRLTEAQRIATNLDQAIAEDTESSDGEVTKQKSRSSLPQRESHSAKEPDDPKSSLSKIRSPGSTSGISREEGETGIKPSYPVWQLIKLILSFNKQDWQIMLLGLAGSIVAGVGLPAQSIMFAKVIVALARPPSQYGLLRSEVNFWCWMYVALAFALLIAWSTRGVSFAYCSERLIRRARDQAFRAMLRQEVGFFDKDENSPGGLTSFLSTQTTLLAGLSGATMGAILDALTTMIGGLVISLVLGWKLALVCIATVPILLACGYLRMFMLEKAETNAKGAYEQSASYACEAISAIRTVASLTREQDLVKSYRQQLADQRKFRLKVILKSSVLFALLQSMTLLCTALAFWYGGTLIVSGEYSLEQFFVIFSAVIFGTQSAGAIFSFAPDMGKAKHAASELKTLFERKSEIDSSDLSGAPLPECKGAIEFKDVHFRYPTRRHKAVLCGLSLSIKQGQYVALVGASGCGKSTTVSLLERFYDPSSGTITIDGRDISELNLLEYRNHLALVAQEPTLYQGTIRENVLMGSDRPDEEITDASIEQACREANIYDFIQSLPNGINTVVGNKGIMLSGGQKQRVAIARALLRNPKVLLLDEATSALDTESEKLVQAALDRAASGRTTIAIAHRLSTIQRADLIYVIDAGRVVEQGSHAQLMARRGRFFELVNLQSLEMM